MDARPLLVGVTARPPLLDLLDFRDLLDLRDALERPLLRVLDLVLDLLWRRVNFSTVCVSSSTCFNLANMAPIRFSPMPSIGAGAAGAPECDPHIGGGGTFIDIGL